MDMDYEDEDVGERRRNQTIQEPILTHPLNGVGNQSSLIEPWVPSCGRRIRRSTRGQSKLCFNLNLNLNFADTGVRDNDISSSSGLIHTA